MVSVADLSHQTAALLGHAVAAQAQQAESLAGRGLPQPSNEDKAAVDAKADAPPLTGAALVVPAALVAAQESKDTKNDFLGQGRLSKDEQKIVAELKKRDAEVRRHERAHSNAAGPYGGLPSYEFQRGPDGQLYAVGGEVSIDTSPEASAEATVRKLETVIRAALAPAEPSPQDHAVAAQARKGKADAEAELRAEKSAEQELAVETRRHDNGASLLGLGHERPTGAYGAASKRAGALAAHALSDAAAENGLIVPGGPQGRSLIA